MTLPDSKDLAAETGLIYSTDESPGFQRKRSGRGFIYLDGQSGEKILDDQIHNRIKALKIPPAWKQVWINKDPLGHLQVTGLDNKGRKQYLYHPDWLKMRNNYKFYRIYEFGSHLPGIRKTVNNHLRRKGLSREKVLATILSIMDVALIRVGNKQYAKNNNSYGLTTLRRKHVDVNGEEMIFEFKSKSGKSQEINLKNGKLARIVKQCSELPGYEIFKYMDEEGNKQQVDSADVNEYIRTLSGEDFTAKNFRTWGGSVLALEEYEKESKNTEQDARSSALTQVIKRVATHLNNTVAICRDYYVHPSVIDLIESEQAIDITDAPVLKKGLSRSENLLLELIKDFEV